MDSASATGAPEGLALLVVDMQAPFLGAISQGDAIVRRCGFCVRAARLLGIPVYVTEQVPEKLGPTVPGVAEGLGEGVRIFAKKHFNAMACGSFADAIGEAGVRHLLVAGIETTICVYQTALAASQAGIDVTLLTDAVGARRESDAAAAMRYLAGHEDCHQLPAETVFYSIVGSAEHPAFREFTRLVKEYA